MLAVFSHAVAKAPEALNNPAERDSAAVKDGSLFKHFNSVNPGSVSMNLGPNAFIAYSSYKQNPLLPRLFSALDGIFCLFQGHIENIATLKQQYGLTKTADEVSIVIEAYRILRDRGLYPADQVVRDFKGKFIFVLYDSTLNSAFAAGDADGSVPFFWGVASNNDLVFSDDETTVKKACGRSFAKFPTGCLFSSSGGLRSFEFAQKELKPTPWVDSSGQVCGSTFKIDEEFRNEPGMLRVGSSKN